MNFIGLSVSLVLLGVFGCAKKSASKNIKQDIDAQVEEIARKHGTSTAAIKEMGNAGGQPVRIILKGQGFLDQQSQQLNQNRVSVASVAGIRCDTHQNDEVKEGHSYDVSGLITQIQPLNSNEKTFINLGCEDSIDKSAIEGLSDATEAELKLYKENGKILLVKASKIFICGEKNMNDLLSVDLKADEIYLNNISFKTAQANAFNLQIEANKLILVGKNHIDSNIAASVIPSVMPVTSQLKISVNQELKGDGTLSVTARGADCIK